MIKTVKEAPLSFTKQLKNDIKKIRADSSH